MKALQTVGLAKALRFVWFGFYSRLLAVSLPPVRIFLLRLAGAHIGGDTVIFHAEYSNLYHYGFRRLVVGRRCFIGDGVMLDVRGGITLEDDVTLSNRVTIVSHINVGYPGHPLQKKYPTRESAVTVKSGAYVGTAAIILSGVIVGRESVVAAGAIVTKNIPDRTLVAGVPATVKKRI